MIPSKNSYPYTSILPLSYFFTCQIKIFVRQLLIVLLLTVVGLGGYLESCNALDFYAAPGAADGACVRSPAPASQSCATLAKPMNFAYAVDPATSPLRAGDILWLLPGRYPMPAAGLYITLKGTANNPIIVRNYKQQRAIIDGALSLQGEYVWVWGLEVTTSHAPPDASLTREQQDALIGVGRAFPESNMRLDYGNFNKIINCIIYDNYKSASYGQNADNAEIYGSLLINTGRRGSDKDSGNGWYSQNLATNAPKKFTDNIIYNTFLDGLNVYAGGETSHIDGFEIKGNIIYGNGHSLNQSGRNLLVGAGINARGIVVEDNLFFNRVSDRPNIFLGYGGGLIDPIIRNNIAIHGGFILRETRGKLVVENNEIYGAELSVRWPDKDLAWQYKFSGNKYYKVNFNPWLYDNSGVYHSDGINLNFSQWQSIASTYRALGDFRPDVGAADQLFFASYPTQGTKIIVRPNRYEAGRAHIGIVNWEGLGSVTITQANLAALRLRRGQKITLRPVQNVLDNEPTQRQEFTYDGNAISVRMSGWKMAQPRGVIQPLQDTFPMFGAFLLTVSDSIAPGAPSNLQLY